MITTIISLKPFTYLHFFCSSSVTTLSCFPSLGCSSYLWNTLKSHTHSHLVGVRWEETKETGRTPDQHEENVHLVIHDNIQSAIYMAKAQCLESIRHRSRASVNVHIEHQNDENVILALAALTKAWLLVRPEIPCQ